MLKVANHPIVRLNLVFVRQKVFVPLVCLVPVDFNCVKIDRSYFTFVLTGGKMQTATSKPTNLPKLLSRMVGGNMERNGHPRRLSLPGIATIKGTSRFAFDFHKHFL